jgi:sulfatase modifying factor 1
LNGRAWKRVDVAVFKEAPLSSRSMEGTQTPDLEGMARIAGGTFLMGSDRHYPEEAPAHKVVVDDFWMDRFAVTNADYRRFVEATK